MFGFGVGTDLKDSNKHILSFEQDGLSFMNRDYYINRTDGVPFDITKPSDINSYFQYIVGVISLLEPTRDTEFRIFIHSL
jgi:predicted metalloendopeptidase